MSLPQPPDDEEMPEVPEVIRCVECGGVAHKIPFQPAEGWEPGDVVTYRCEDCDERLDVVV
ncbi:MAG: hypothetical protein ACE5MI_01925 [Acidimicrobiia bacterium]